MPATEVINLAELTTRDLYKEWAIWSKCLGKVIVINGVSSVGKTTLLNYLGKLGFNKISIDDVYDQMLFNYLANVIPDELSKVQELSIKRDDIKKIIQGCKINKNKYEHIQLQAIKYFENSLTHISNYPLKVIEINDKIYNMAKPFIFSGYNVVIETVMCNDEQIDCFSYCFSYYPYKMILLYSSLSDNLKKCFLRNELSFQNDLFDYRGPETIIEQYYTIYRCVTSNGFEIERINKTATKDALAQVISHVNKYFNHFYDESMFDSYIQKVSQTCILIEKTMELSRDNDVFIAPAIKFDHVIFSTYTDIIESVIDNVDLVDLIGQLDVS